MIKKTNNRLVRVWMVLLTAIMLFSCSDDDSPFEGKDHYLVSFSLIVNEITYQGAIFGTDIIVSIPTDANLSGAEVTYELSEQAGILPDPGTIDNWDQEQVFRVEAYNGSYTSYRYTVNRTDIIQGENVSLLTQSDVDEFAESKINRISGNLIIGSAGVNDEVSDPVTELSGLSTLTAVDLNVVINDSYAGESLSGLDHLTRVGGLYIGTTLLAASSRKQIAVSLPELESAGNVVINTDSLTGLLLPKLVSVGNILVNSILLSDADFSSLTECSGDLTIKAITGSTYSEEKSNQVLKSLEFPSLRKVLGTLFFENLWKLASLELPLLNTVGEDIQLKYIRTIENISLPALTDVSGLLNVQANDGMSTFTAPLLTRAKSVNIASINIYSINLLTIGLGALEMVQEDFVIQYAGSEKMEFPKLSDIGGTLQLSNLQFLEEVSVPELRTCGTIKLDYDQMLTAFDASGLSSLGSLSVSSCKRLAVFYSPEEITGDVTLQGGNKVCDFTEFAGLETIGGTLSVSYYNNPQLSIPHIKSVGAYTQISGSYLTSLALPDLENAGDFTLSGMTALTALSVPKLEKTVNFTLKSLFLLDTIDLSALTTVSGTFTLYGGSYAGQASQSIIPNLDAFSTLTTAGKVDIRYAGHLADFSGLKNVIGSMTASDWTVEGCLYNPTYQDMVNGKYTN